MKLLHVDWEACLGFLEAWESLTPPARLLLLDARPRAVLPGRALADERAALLAGRFVRELDDGERVQLSEAFHETHKVLRSLARHPLLRHPEPRTLREYLSDHFTNAERQAMSGSAYHRWDHDALLIEAVTSAGHVRGFLASKNRREWERERLAKSGGYGEQAWTQSTALLAGKHAAADLASLLETLVAAKEPIPLRALRERVGALSPARLAHALEASLRYLLAFPAFDAELVPVLTLWPGVAGRLARIPAPPPAAVEPEDTFCMAYRAEDLTQLLVRAAEPMRMKANEWSLFAAVERELVRGLLPLPSWLTHARAFPENAPEERVREALALARELGFLAPSGKRGRDLGLVATPAAWRWLDQEPRERLRVILELFRPEPGPARERKGARVEPEEQETSGELRLVGPEEELEELGELLDEALEGLDEADDGELVPFDAGDSRGARALSDATLFGTSPSRGLADAAIAAYARLAPGRAVSFGAFLSHHAEGSNPFPALEDRAALAFAHNGRRLSEEALEELWSQGLRRILHHHLLPFGGVKAGLTSTGALTIELTPVGRYLLGLASDFTLDAAPPAKTPVRVQPDFEVVFVARSPALEAALSRFAERRGTGVGVLFRITRASILQAAQAGLGADEVLATLAGASTTPVPANVAHEIRAWFAGCRRLRIEPVHLVRCPDAATAARVLSAAGAGKLEALSETVLVLTDPAHKAAVTRACRKAGLFLVSEVHASAERGPGARWRR